MECFILCIWLIYTLDSLIKVLIRDNLGQINGIAVEWESGLLYFTDYIYERIEVVKVDGSFRKTLFSSNLYSPRGIAVDPKSG